MSYADDPEHAIYRKYSSSDHEQCSLEGCIEPCLSSVLLQRFKASVHLVFKGRETFDFMAERREFYESEKEDIKHGY